METDQVPTAHRMLSQMPWEATTAKHAVAFIIMGTMGQHRHLQPPEGAANLIWKSIGLQVSYVFF
jgi:hypothetical protein